MHDWVDHTGGEYVRGDIHTQTIEGLWGFMKRRLKAVGGVQRRDLPLFIGEQLWRYTFRHLIHEKQMEQLLNILTRISGKF